MRDAFRRLGHDAWSCDIEPSEDSRYHLRCDVLDALAGVWDLAIFHPPCTFLANSSSKHLYIDKKKENGPDPERWHEMRKGAEFFKHLLECKNIPHKAAENPIMLGYAKEIIGRGQDQLIHPYHFGDPFQKATCLWLDELPPLKLTYQSWEECRVALGLPEGSKPKQEVHLMGPSADRQAKRSVTYPGIAEAMAQQWSAHVLSSA